MLKYQFWWQFLSAANDHSTEQRFEFKLQKNLATARQTEGFGLET